MKPVTLRAGAAAALSALLTVLPILTGSALAQEAPTLSEQIQELRGAIRKPSWIEFSGDFRVRHDKLVGKIPTYSQVGYTAAGVPTFTTVQSKTARNDSLLTTRLGLNAKIQPAQDVSLKTRLLMYKTWGMADSGATQAGLAADRQNTVFDGTIGHVPSGNTLYVDQAYGTINYLFGQPIWFSAGRRPSTDGSPTNFRDNRVIEGAGGTPGLLVNYAFDGATLGIAPDFEGWSGFAAKLCYGRGYDAGYLQSGVTPQDTDMFGVNLVGYESPDLRVEAQYNRGFNIFDSFPGPNVKTNLGDIEWYGANTAGTMRDLGPGDLTGFLSGAMSASLPNRNRYNANFGTNNPGLMCDASDCQNKKGLGIYLGGRYDLKKTRTKIGAEFNYGTKNWITFVPAADDMWSSKLGTRGRVYEAYVVQELARAPKTKEGLAFFRVGWQYYDYAHTSSNGWVGAPKAINELGTAARAQFLAPVKSAYDLYTTFEIRF